MPSNISKFKQPHNLLNQILDQPDLPAIVQKLDSGVLSKLIHHVGLEDATQIVALVSADQLKGIFDEDLWHSKSPGQAEAFDAERFGLWLEVLLESGSEFAAKKVMELDEDLVTLGLCRLVLVVEMSDMAMRFSDEWQSSADDLMERVMDSSFSMGFDNFLVLSKSTQHWDAVCALLSELNGLDDERLTRLLERCRRISIENIEYNGDLFNVLTGDEMLEEDVAADREERREGKGFVTSASAAVFLSQARTTPLKKIIENKAMDFATRVYMKSAKTTTEPDPRPQNDDTKKEREESDLDNIKAAKFIQTLQEAEVLPSSDRKLLGYEDTDGEHHLPLVKAMSYISKRGPDLYEQLVTEFSYLSNILVSGCAIKGCAFQPKEAAEAAFSVCNLGCEVLLKTDFEQESKLPIRTMVNILEAHRLIKLFQVGWKILFDNVVMFTAKSILAFLNTLKGKHMDMELIYEACKMVNQLNSCIKIRRPWEFIDQMDNLLIYLDGATVTALAALMEECPTLSEAICDIEKPPASPFIYSKSQIGKIRGFLLNSL